MELMCKLDWLAFTFPHRIAGDSSDKLSSEGILGIFHSFTAGVYIGVVSSEIWPRVPAHGFFTDCIQCPITGITISWSGTNSYAQAVMTGKACDAVTERLEIPLMMKSCDGRATRIDLAVDIECDVTPGEFVARRSSRRIKTAGSFLSDSGETQYVGSRSGERMARVYRYKEPHPRHRLLRAEVEYKGDAAKMLCTELGQGDLTSITLSAHAPFGWQHPVWDTSQVTISKIPARPYDKANDGRWKWLTEVAWKSLLKAHEEGIIDLLELFKDIDNPPSP